MQERPPTDTAYEYNYPHLLQLRLHGLSLGRTYIYLVLTVIRSYAFRPSKHFPTPTELAHSPPPGAKMATRVAPETKRVFPLKG